MDRKVGDYDIEVVAANGVIVCRCKDRWVADELGKIVRHQFGNVTIREVS